MTGGNPTLGELNQLKTEAGVSLICVALRVGFSYSPPPPPPPPPANIWNNL